MNRWNFSAIWVRRAAAECWSFGGDRPIRFGNAGRSGGWRFIRAGGSAIGRVGGPRGPRWWWHARRLVAVVRGSGPPSVRSITFLPGRPLGEPAVSDGCGGWGWRAAESIGPRRRRAYAARVAAINAGSRPAGGCRWSASAEQCVAGRPAESGRFYASGRGKRWFDLAMLPPSAGA
jgi:hypothetical protein